MRDPLPSASDVDSRLADPLLEPLIEEYTRRVREGEALSIDEFAKLHPGQEAALRRLLPAAQAMAELAAGNGAGPADWDPGAGPTTRDLGDFRLLREIGRGGMGVVYDAEQLSLGRRVAVKVLPFASVLDARQLQRFRNEARAAATLHHSHIVAVYSVGTERGVHFYAMELIDGRSLAEVLIELRGPESEPPTGTTLVAGAAVPAECDISVRIELFPGGPPGPAVGAPESTGKVQRISTVLSARGREYFRQVARWGIQAAQALEHAHQLGIVHRDVKPSNLLVNAEGHLWVTDFGLAMTAADSNLTMTGDVLGTLRYMSPEQARGERRILDQRTDIYSLGITLYELLTLKPAFPGNNRAELLRQIAEVDPAPPRKLDKHIPPELETIVMKAMEREPGHRYQAARDLADDLQRYLRDEPIRAQRPSLPQIAIKWSRRHWRMVISAAVLSLLAVVGLIVSTLLIAQERDAARDAAGREREAAGVARQERQRAFAERDAAEYNLYVADMHLAYQHWKAGQIQGMLNLLDAHEAVPGVVDRRGWEWRYLKSLTRPDPTTIETNSGTIWWLAWSPDGRLLAVGGQDVRIWDPSTRRTVAVLQRSLPIDEDRDEGDWPIAWSPDGKQLAIATSGNLIRIWDPREGTELASVGPQATRPNRIAWSPDAKQLATGDKSGNVRIWELGGDPKPALLRGNVEWVRSLQWSPDGRFLAAGDNFHGWLDVWDPARRKLAKSFKAHSHFIKGLAWSPDNRFLATGSKDQRLKVWNTETWTASLEIRAHLGSVDAISWSPDGKWMASGGADTNVKIWDAATGRSANTLRGHRSRVRAVAWSPDGARVASAGTDNTVRLWEPFRPQDNLPVNGRAPVAWSPDGNRLLCNRVEYGVIGLFDSRSAALERELRFDGGHSSFSLDWSPAGNRVVTGHHDGSIKLWDAASGRELWHVAAAHARPEDDADEVRSLHWKPDGRLLASGGMDRTVKIWDPAAGKLVETLRIHEAPVGSVQWSPDGRRLAAKDFSQSIKVWNTETWRIDMTLKCHPFFTIDADGRYSLAWSPDGGRLAAGTSEGWVIIWNMETGREQFAMRGHAGNVRCVSWSPDGLRLASGAEDQMVKIWDVTTGREMLTIEGHDSWVASVA
ncbi:MAG TPA: protein kinase, partial [Planctomycetaceae bacterium]|nr:protein kinase [Planctomycetaceae bacterium]